jgi:hypothetical protein
VTSPLGWRPFGRLSLGSLAGLGRLMPSSLDGAPQVLALGLGALLLSVPMGALPIAELQALNRELGRLCSDPPREALAVCRLHARLVRTL